MGLGAPTRSLRLGFVPNGLLTPVKPALYRHLFCLWGVLMTLQYRGTESSLDVVGTSIVLSYQGYGRMCQMI